MVYFSGGGSHTLSLGMPDTVDYYVTGDGAAPSGLQANLNEQIVRIGDIGIFHFRAEDVLEEETYQVEYGAHAFIA